jgi:hypothetical protein
MSNGTYLRFNHSCDIYRRVIEVNDAGQKRASFPLSKTSMPCAFQTISSERRIAPYVDNVDEFQLIVPHLFQNFISYQGRVENVKDRYGNVIEKGPFEIIQIEKKTGFNSKVHHVIVTIRLVVENG